MSNSRTVNCAKLGKELPGLSQPPFSGDLGNEIFEKVSAQAWNMWQDDMMIKVINEYRLNMADPEQYQALLVQMRAFLNLGAEAAVLEVGNEARGRAN